MTQSVSQFNEQLLLYAEAGVPLGLDLSSIADEPTEAVKQIESMLQQHREQFASANEDPEEAAWHAVRDRLPGPYVQLVEAGLRIGSIPDVWQRLQESEADSVASATKVSRFRTWFYPAACGIIAYVGFLILCRYTVPQLLLLASESEINAGVVLRTLGRLSASLRWWAPVVPALVVGGIAANGRRTKRLPDARSMLKQRRTRVGVRDAIRAARAGQFAGVASLFYRYRLSKEDVLERASAIAGSPEVTEVCLRDLGSPGTAEANRLDRANKLPLLQWALESPSIEDHGEALMDAVAISYGRLADLKSQRSANRLPLVAGLVVGGSVALLYGLALFVPLADLLEKLASAR